MPKNTTYVRPDGSEGPGAPRGAGEPPTAPAQAASSKPKAPKKAPTKARGKKKTTMMEQFRRAKAEAPDALLFFRMGDFYELFHEDAKIAARELGIALTARSKDEDPIPMAGVPVRSMEGHLIRLVRKGFKVAICEQLTDPKVTKGIVERGIVRVVTPGTLTEEEALDARAPNFLAALFLSKDRSAGIAWVDLSTGRFQVVETRLEDLVDELGRIGPAELLLPDSIPAEHPELYAELDRLLGPRCGERDAWRFARDSSLRVLKNHFGVATLEGYGLSDDSPTVPAAGALIEYVEETQRSTCEHVRRIELVTSSDHLILDRATRACLELVSTQLGGRSEGTLLETLDRTRTPMGGRLLREWLLAPLSRVEPIRERQGGVAELVEAARKRDELRELLGEVLDVERLVGKVSTGRANGRDLLAIGRSLGAVPGLLRHLEDCYSSALARLLKELDPREALFQRLTETLVDAPPPTIREGGLIRPGVHAELDELREIAGAGKSWMARFQAQEAERTGIAGLKVGFNSVFGYFVEVPRGQVERVPEEYVRKQTIKNAERYITPELKEYEGKVLGAEERSRDLEYDLFLELREDVARETGALLDTARAVAELDVLAGLAQLAAENAYVQPTVDEDGILAVVEGRHPVIERSAACENFVPNDSRLDHEGHNLAILTGPNMAGKSTYIRQTALIVLLAQMGSFVPAKEARIGLVDRIFTRVGAGDDISRGASTFMVEMVEIANILNHASERSLVVLDEVGRGTSTFDGLALAWAIAEHLHTKIGARTVFATHYHQLTDLAERHRGICNLNVAVREIGEEIVFLHRIVEGGTDRSYGIHVARLAGVPVELVERAREILNGLEEDADDLAPKISANAGTEDADAGVQLSLFGGAPSKVEAALKELDPDQLTPIDALLKLRELRELL